MTLSFSVRRLTLAETYDVRVNVLRRGTPTRDAVYDGDDDATTVHIGAAIDDRVVATSTWLRVAWPHEPDADAVQLRGMAVLDHVQGTGIGRSLIDAGIEHARGVGAEYVWAKARDSAIAFYERCGFTVVGEGFMEPASGLPHHLVVCRLTAQS